MFNQNELSSMFKTFHVHITEDYFSSQVYVLMMINKGRSTARLLRKMKHLKAYQISTLRLKSNRKGTVVKPLQD